MKEYILPMSKEELLTLKAGDTLSVSGEIYTARDAAHKRLYNLIENNEELPLNLQDCWIYYAGPCPQKPGQIINSCGPTTASRMNKYAPTMFAMGMQGVIAKGEFCREVTDAIIAHKGVYLCATGGAGALISKCVLKQEFVAFEDLGTEAIVKLTVKEMPLIVGTDSKGNSLFSSK